jgi:hypothetical protein
MKNPKRIDTTERNRTLKNREIANDVVESEGPAGVVRGCVVLVLLLVLVVECFSHTQRGHSTILCISKWHPVCLQGIIHSVLFVGIYVLQTC